MILTIWITVWVIIIPLFAYFDWKHRKEPVLSKASRQFTSLNKEMLKLEKQLFKLHGKQFEIEKEITNKEVILRDLRDRSVEFSDMILNEVKRMK